MYRLSLRANRRSVHPQFNDNLLRLLVEHTILNVKNYGNLSALMGDTMELVAMAKKPLQSKDRLYNPEIDFPIGIGFGNSDFLGSEGSEEIIQNNKYYKTGESQLFKLENSGHNMQWHNPKGLTEIMIGFFEGSIKGTF